MTTRPWTDIESDWLTSHWGSLNGAQLSDRLRRSITGVVHRAKQLHLTDTAARAERDELRQRHQRIAALTDDARHLVNNRPHFTVERGRDGKASAIVWTEELDDLVRDEGLSVNSVADRLGVGWRTAKERRDELLGGESAPRTTQKIHWDDDMDDVLRRLGTEEAARELGVSESAVLRRRRIIGFAPPGRAYVWTPEADELVLAKKAGEAARELGVSLRSVQRRRATLRKAVAA